MKDIEISEADRQALSAELDRLRGERDGLFSRLGGPELPKASPEERQHFDALMFEIYNVAARLGRRVWGAPGLTWS